MLQCMSREQPKSSQPMGGAVSAAACKKMGRGPLSVPGAHPQATPAGEGVGENRGEGRGAVKSSSVRLWGVAPAGRM